MDRRMSNTFEKQEGEQLANVWKDGMYGLIVANALGVPVELNTRESLKANDAYGFTGIPCECVNSIQRRTWIDEMIGKM